MARFHELMGQMREPGEDGLPESIYDDLTSEYDTLFDGSSTTIADRDAVIAARDEEITRLKSKNYDLLVNVSGGASSATVEGELDNENTSEPTIESLFERKDA
jgi:pheromone shutdown protein TraB